MEHAHTNQNASGEHKMQNMEAQHYTKLLVMIILSFAAMFFLMYAMVDHFPNVVLNINQVYMAALMTAAMVVIELVIMGGMYKNKKRNIIILIAGVLVGTFSYLGIRQQSFVGDKQFLKSMIPHHAAAILMVEKSDLTDPEVKQLAQDIISSQQKEIDFMKAKIKAMETK
ncbi:MAG: DUF305 domain-containing protein [Bacteroidota bacterium]